MKHKILTAVLIFSLTACSAPPTPTDSGVEGQVLIGPMCPIVQEGQECPDQPYQATLTVLSPNGRRIVQVQTDEQGRFKIPLAPGEYILHPESPNGLPFASDQNFVVEAGRFTDIVVNYDSGIR
ncbi:MAG: carboxypeptidase-like regulatory domain-containing protein [Chloroflexota bacterium]